MIVKGADFSYYDGGSIPFSTLDWGSYTWDFAVIKASEGVVSDPLFERQWAAARGHTLRAAYHFFRPSVDPKLSAQRTLDLLNGDLGELPLMFDLEATDDRSDTMDRAKSWLSWYEQWTGIRPVVYSSPGFLNTVQAWKCSWLANYKLWLATYPFDEMKPVSLRSLRIQSVLSGDYPLFFPNPPAPFKRVSFLQWTGKGLPEDVPGYYLGSGHKLAVDLNFYNGSYDEMIREFDVKIELDPVDPPPTPSDPQGETMQGKVLVTLNVRSGPGTEYPSVGKLAPGDIVEADAKPNGWWRLTKVVSNGQEVKYVSPTGSIYAYEGQNNGYIQDNTPPSSPDRPVKITVEMKNGSVWVADQFTELT